jgi:hypothetical protein
MECQPRLPDTIAVRRFQDSVSCSPCNVGSRIQEAKRLEKRPSMEHVYGSKD